MIIRNMFSDDINRKIKGVVNVSDSVENVIEQELNEYVVTRELKKHLLAFFNYYNDMLDHPTSDIGVWISGFFGSGKSHFLKMLSYLLENKEVNGVKSVEIFRKKFEDDPATFMLIDHATKGETQTILFNIDIEGSMYKDKTAVLRVFAKMFYNHLGFFGDNLKVAMLEKYIDELGKTDEFRRVFEQKKGMPWIDQRKVFAFNGKFIIPTLMEVLDMSEEDARAWFNDKSAVDISIAGLVDDIKAYVRKKPSNYRLLFMVDEAGQYVGTDTDMLLNLQSLTERIGTECGGKVWVVCTGQEAIDEIIKVRADEFSRIQARFKTRLSLSSSSVDEVIQKRVLSKTAEAKTTLETVYEQNDSVLRNLFSFDTPMRDIKGFTGSKDFSVNFPFVPYQFIIIQKVFVEIRKHGNAGKHMSGGERSMLSGFQEAAQKVQDKDEYALVPFFRFYDTVNDFLESQIRRVIDRCQKAADNGNGIEQQDVDVLKLLYLIRYIDDIPANLDNIVILMADDIRVDKIVMRESMRASLDRLMSQNYIGRTGDTYNFLTDEEQDIQKEIRNELVDTSSVVEKIGQMIFGEIFTTSKYRYNPKYDFAFDKYVDGTSVGVSTGGIRLRFLTEASDGPEKDKFNLMIKSKGQEAIVVLSDTNYYESLESAMKIRKYVKKRNVALLAKSVQDIIRNHQDEATKLEADAMECLRKAIEGATFYVDGECLEIKGGDAKAKIEQALGYLVEHVYSDLSLITRLSETDADILNVLSEMTLDGMSQNADAAAKIEEYLEMQHLQNRATSMFDVQTKFSGVPFGWREIDIAAVVALLIAQQKVTIKYGGTTIQPDDKRIPDILRKKSEIAKTQISKRVAISAQKIKQTKEFLREYFDVMDIPDDEDGLIKYIVSHFESQKTHYTEIMNRYSDRKYPDRSIVSRAIELTNDILSAQKDNTALIDRLVAKIEDLEDNKDDMANVESFFANQVTIFDAAVKLEENMRNDLSYIQSAEEGNQALCQIRLIIEIKDFTRYNYKRIPELNGLMATVKTAHDALLAKKREEVLEIVRQCMSAIHTASNNDSKCRDAIATSDNYYAQRKEQIASTTGIALLDGLVPQMWQYKDSVCERIESMLKPVEPKPVNPTPNPGPKKIIKAIHRQAIFPTKTLESDQDIDEYVEKMRETLKQMLKGSDGIKLN